jgi:hypothetical protein
MFRSSWHRSDVWEGSLNLSKACYFMIEYVMFALSTANILLDAAKVLKDGMSLYSEAQTRQSVLCLHIVARFRSS